MGPIITGSHARVAVEPVALMRFPFPRDPKPTCDEALHQIAVTGFEVRFVEAHACRAKLSPSIDECALRREIERVHQSALESTELDGARARTDPSRVYMAAHRETDGLLLNDLNPNRAARSGRPEHELDARRRIPPLSSQ